MIHIKVVYEKQEDQLFGGPNEKTLIPFSDLKRPQPREIDVPFPFTLI